MEQQRGEAHAAADSLTRRGLEESVRLLDEQLSRSTQRAERESLQRREAERRCAAPGELVQLRAEASHAVQRVNGRRASGWSARSRIVTYRAVSRPHSRSAPPSRRP